MSYKNELVLSLCLEFIEDDNDFFNASLVSKYLQKSAKDLNRKLVLLQLPKNSKYEEKRLNSLSEKFMYERIYSEKEADALQSHAYHLMKKHKHTTNDRDLLTFRGYYIPVLKKHARSPKEVLLISGARNEKVSSLLHNYKVKHVYKNRG